MTSFETTHMVEAYRARCEDRIDKPAPFWHGPLTGVLLVGSDGFFSYAKRDQLTPMIARTDFFAIPRACLELVRLPSGELWDDSAVVACRVRSVRPSKKRYTI